MRFSAEWPVLKHDVSEKIGTVICFSHLRWRFVVQRPQHLLTRAARDCLVWFIEEPVHTDGPPHVERFAAPEGVTVLTPMICAGAGEDARLALQRSLVEAVARESEGTRSVAWYYTPMALRFSEALRPDLIVYDNMDELSAFRGAPPSLLELEDELFRRADLVFTGGQSLYLAKKHRHRNIWPFPSSIDASHFLPARRKDFLEPADQASIAHPRLGFFGVIDERLDVELVAAIAEQRPDWQLVMIGPVVKIDPATLPRRANIHWLGAKSYGELPAYLSGWDIGIMPFALNEATRFISPTKTPEFLAAGLRVISTAITDVVEPYGNKGLVAIASSPAEFLARAQSILAGGRSPDWLARVDAHLGLTSWDRTWASMQRAMYGALRRRSEGRAAQPVHMPVEDARV